ncbi:ladderlectin-like [Clarias gariepinus]|uniref:ladderlectin-like n=1 Tax=Clarias gariepinus TaxID=13013 RepID=UPI00234C0D4E|nr:ladderlectin-like [Clarias gariepinus]
MKVWVVCMLLCAAFRLRTATAAAIETEPEQDQKVPGETTELVVEEVIEAAEDKVGVLKLDDDAEDKYNYCPSGWVKYGSRCFRLMRSIQSWLNAEAQCVAQQARLASVHNLGEYNFLQSLLDMAGVPYAWIGAYYFQGAWLWADTARFQYTNWYSLIDPFSCPCTYMRNNVGWSNSNCANGYAFVCAIDLHAC